MALRSDNHGVGAIVSALLRFIHPSKHIRNKFPNVVQGQHLENCETIRQEVKRVSRKEQLVLVVRHEDFKNPDDSHIELHGVKRYWKVSQEGHPDYFFDGIAPTDENANSQDETLMPEEFLSTSMAIHAPQKQFKPYATRWMWTTTMNPHLRIYHNQLILRLLH